MAEKTTKKKKTLPAEPTGPKDEEEKGVFEKLFFADYWKKQNLKNIVQVEKKKAQKEKNYDEVYKWWKENEPNLSYGYQGWPGVN